MSSASESEFSNPLPRTVEYLIVGGGAMGMAFTDVLLSETDSTVLIVDSRARPEATGTTLIPTFGCISLRRSME